jgi:ABC-type antimicrobial peptide transport system permease subunit
LAAGRVRLHSLSDGGRLSRNRPRDLFLAIPVGIGLYLALFGIAGDTTEEAVIAPWWSLALIPIGTVLVVVAATSLPARLATRIRIAEPLRYE